MDTAMPESGFQKFKKSKVAFPIGVVIALLVGVGLFYMGIQQFACGLGFVLIAAAVFIIIKWFNGKDVKKMAIFGALFFVTILLAGIFVMAIPTMDNHTDPGAINGNGFSGAVVNFQDDTHSVITDVSVFYTGDMTDKKIAIHIDLGSVMFNSYRVVDGNNSMNYDLTLVDGKYTYTGNINLNTHTLYGYYFVVYDTIGEQKEVARSAAVLIKSDMSQTDQISLAFTSSIVSVATVTVLYAIIVFFSIRASKNMEKVRADMEAEGRLYPKGYGRCKNCGTVVLPGETHCRKCGTFIEVPEEYKKNLSEYFECSECGAQIPADSIFCPKCGAKFDEEEETVVVSESTEQTSEQKAIEPAPEEVAEQAPARETEQASEESTEQAPEEKTAQETTEEERKE